MHPSLDVKKCAYAAVGVFVLLSVYEFAVRHVVMMPAFPEMAGGGPAPENIWILRFWNYLGKAVFAIMFAFLFAKGYEGKPGLGEGFRFGLWIGLLIDVPIMFSAMVSTSLTGSYIVVRMLFGVLGRVLCGIVAGALYKVAPKPAA